jgi:Transposase
VCKLPLSLDHGEVDSPAGPREGGCGMRFSKTQIVEILKEGEAGLPVAELLRKHGISRATCFQRKAKYQTSDATPSGSDPRVGPVQHKPARTLPFRAARSHSPVADPPAAAEKRRRSCCTDTSPANSRTVRVQRRAEPPHLGLSVERGLVRSGKHRPPDRMVDQSHRRVRVSSCHT